MPCTIKGLNLNPKELAIVEGVANGNDKKAAIIAAYLKEDANFIEFASKDSKWRGSIENTPHNTCVRLLNEYYKKQHPSVVNFRRSRIGTELNGFSSVHAKYIAYRHTAGIISALYYDLAKNKDVNRKDRADILRRCSTTIRSKFVTEYINPLINSDEFKNNSTGKNYIEVKTILEQINKLFVNWFALGCSRSFVFIIVGQCCWAIITNWLCWRTT